MNYDLIIISISAGAFGALLGYLLVKGFEIALGTDISKIVWR